MKITAKAIKDLVNENFEDNSAIKKVADVLRVHDGEKLTKRLIPELEKVSGSKVTISQRYDMTYLRFDGFEKSDLLIGYGKNLPDIDADFFIDRNPADFRGADKRNAERNLITAKDRSALAKALNAYIKAREDIKTLTDYGKPFDADEYAIMKMAGIKE